MRNFGLVCLLAFAGAACSDEGEKTTDDSGATGTTTTTATTGTTQDSHPPDSGATECISCGESLGAAGSGQVCEGESQSLQEALINCACNVSCAAQCGDNACTGAGPSAECGQCLQDTTAGCGNEYQACLQDL